MDKGKNTLKIHIAWRSAEAHGRLAVWTLFVIALVHRCAWPLAAITALALGWIHIEHVEILKKIFASISLATS